jgi:splicing factor 3B subunit 2
MPHFGCLKTKRPPCTILFVLFQAPDTSGMQTPIVDAGMATPSGMSSVGAPGQETPELIELRKRRIEQDMEGGETPNLYTILPEKKNERMGAGTFFTVIIK